MANEYLQRTPTSTGNRRVWTWSTWVKRNSLTSTNQNLLCSTEPGLISKLFFNTNDKLDYQNNSPSFELITSQTFRDVGNWFHILFVAETTASISSERIRIYVNGTRITKFDTETYPAINSTLIFNYPIAHFISKESSSTNWFIGEFADVFFIDGQALTPDVFGFYKQGKGYISAGSTQSTDFRPGQWVPKTPRVIKTEINRRGGFGVNGFYLPMNDSNNFGADFHGDPNSIITLNEKLPQPRVGVATTASVGLGYTDALRADPFAANLVLALPFVSGGLSSGFGDYAPSIKGSGSAKTVTVNGSVSVANTHGYYGNAAFFNGSSGNYLSLADNTDFEFGSGDYTVEFWCNPSRSVNFEEIVSKGFPWQLYRSSNSQFSLAVSSDNSNYWINSNIGVGAINQWHHIAVSKKGSTTYGFLNGVCGLAVTNSSSVFDGTSSLVIGSYEPAPNLYLFQGYIQDFRVYKGVAKYTGGFDVPRPYTPVGIATWRAVPDTTANNFCTWNPVSPASDTTFTNGNLTVAYGSNATRGVVTGTVGIAVTGAGKYYWENRVDASSTSPTNAMIGVWGMSTTTSAANYPGFTNTYGWSYYGDGSLYSAKGGAVSFPAYGATYTTGDIIGVTFDMTTNNGSLEFYKNGVSQGVATTGIGTFLTDGKIHAIMPALGDGAGTATYTVSSNFGQNPTFSGNTTAGTFTDSNGKGLFKYQPPTGFLALCEDNLPTPAIADPGDYFKTVLYRGDNISNGVGQRAVSGVGFKPDLVWIKCRNYPQYHVIYDSVRGLSSLNSNTTAAEAYGTQLLGGYNDDGFTTSANNDSNYNLGDYVAWCWRAGAGTTSTNTDGSIQSVVSVNQDAGFSIVSYTGNNTSGATVGHGLGKTPAFMIIKSRGPTAKSWGVYHKSIGNTGMVYLDLTNATNTASFHWNNTSPTSTTFTLGNGSVTNSAENIIAYCWAEIEGFSKFGSYSANFSADGPFCYCGFRPALVIIKRTDSTGSWVLKDSSRNSANPADLSILAQTSDTEFSNNSPIDFLSNGFKLRSTSLNDSGATFIFAAWAESPFQTANSK